MRPSCSSASTYSGRHSRKAGSRVPSASADASARAKARDRGLRVSAPQITCPEDPEVRVEQWLLAAQGQATLAERPRGLEVAPVEGEERRRIEVPWRLRAVLCGDLGGLVRVLLGRAPPSCPRLDDGQVPEELGASTLVPLRPVSQAGLEPRAGPVGVAQPGQHVPQALTGQPQRDANHPCQRRAGTRARRAPGRPVPLD